MTDNEKQTESFVRAWNVFGEQVQTSFRRIVEAMRPLIEWANTPEVRAALAESERRRVLGLYDTEGCHCLCGVRHSDHPVCLGEVLRRELVTVGIGAVNVPMCPPCARVAEDAPRSS